MKVLHKEKFPPICLLPGDKISFFFTDSDNVVSEFTETMVSDYVIDTMIVVDHEDEITHGLSNARSLIIGKSTE